MSGFTPGPWGVNKYGSIGAGEFFTHPIVAHVEPFYGDDGPGSHVANARLIAAAPAMYEALKMAAKVLTSEVEDEDFSYTLLSEKAVLAALAAANGNDAEDPAK